MYFARRFASHSAQALAEAGLIALVVVGLIAGSALAAPGGKGGGGTTTSATVKLKILEDANLDGQPNHLDVVTFTISQSATNEPMVGLRCWQASSFVHDGYIALYDASWLAKHFILDSDYWDPDANADCTARLFYWDRRGREKVLATTTFVVAP